MVCLAHAGQQRHLHRGAVVAGAGEEQRVRAPPERGQHADRHQRVHRRLGLTEVLGGCTVEGPGRPGGHRSAHREGEPLPVAELERRHHRQQQYRCAEDTGDHQAPQQRVADGIGCIRRAHIAGGRRGHARPVADRFDRGDEVARHHVLTVEGDHGLLGGVVDRGRHALEPVQLLLDARCTRCARHAGELELDAVGEDRPRHGLLDGGHDRPPSSSTTTVNSASTTVSLRFTWRNRRYVPAPGSEEANSRSPSVSLVGWRWV